MFMAICMVAQTAQKPVAIPAKTETGVYQLGDREIESIQKAQVVDLWTADFSDESLWTLGNEGEPDQDWVIGTAGPTGFFSEGMGPIASSSAGNGFALYDSDAWGDNFSFQDAWIGNADPIDLSAYPNVQLSFEHYYRNFQGSAFVEFSANGTDWTAIELATDVAVNSSTENPRFDVVDASAIIGGSSTAYFRFRYTGGWDYAWMVDDVVLFETAQNDLALSYIFMAHVEGGYEYARVPASQMGDLTWGTEYYNFGIQTQNNSAVNIVFTDEMGTEIDNQTSPGETLNAGDTTYYEATISHTWEEGVYTGDYTISSDEEQGGDNFANNTESRNFRIDNGAYGIDGIDTYETTSLASLGTNSFTDAGADGFILLNQFEIVNETDVYGLEFFLTTTSVEGGLIYVGLLDTTDVFNDNATQDFWIVGSDEYTVTADDVTNQFVQIEFEDVTTLAPGNYFAAVELNSFANANDLRVLDDQTVPQPFDASMIYLPEDVTVYSNGNAFSIRLMMDETGSLVGLDETEAVNFVGGIRPNPATDNAQFNFELVSTKDVTIMITDALGKQVSVERLGRMAPGTYVHELNLSGVAAGMHHLTILTEDGRTTLPLSVVK